MGNIYRTSFGLKVSSGYTSAWKSWWCCQAMMSCLPSLRESRQQHLELSKLERPEQQMCSPVLLWVTNNLSEHPLSLWYPGNRDFGWCFHIQCIFHYVPWLPPLKRESKSGFWWFQLMSPCLFHCLYPAQIWVVWSSDLIMAFHFHVQKGGYSFCPNSDLYIATAAAELLKLLCLWR